MRQRGATVKYDSLSILKKSMPPRRICSLLQVGFIALPYKPLYTTLGGLWHRCGCKVSNNLRVSYLYVIGTGQTRHGSATRPYIEKIETPYLLCKVAQVQREVQPLRGWTCTTPIASPQEPHGALLAPHSQLKLLSFAPSPTTEEVARTTAPVNMARFHLTPRFTQGAEMPTSLALALASSQPQHDCAATLVRAGPPAIHIHRLGSHQPTPTRLLGRLESYACDARSLGSPLGLGLPGCATV